MPGGVAKELNPDKQEKKAKKPTRLKAFGDPYDREGLECSCDSLNKDSRVNALAISSRKAHSSAFSKRASC
jgi:hypothetical protein